MHSELWFVTDGVKVLSAFRKSEEAERELGRYEDDPDFQYYDSYAIEVDNLVDYPDEYELAMDLGLID